MNSTDMELKKVVLREIEPVLRQKLGNEVIVENFTTKSLLPPGENYGSTILSVHVELKKNDAAEKEDLHLIAKMLPPTEFQRRIFNSRTTFLKEIFMYDTIMPEYNKLEIECGLKPTEVFDILAKFYGSRLSLHPDTDLDDNAVILMENLKVRGYYMGDRKVGHDIEQAQVVIKALARFHALGMAMKQKRPEIFKTFKMKATPLESETNLGDVFKTIRDAIKNDEEMNVYYDKCRRNFDRQLTDKNFWSEKAREPWTTIVHADFWVNNMLFHDNDDGQIDDIKFVDFQVYLYGSPVRELQFYLLSSINMEITDEQIEGFIDLYYETLIERLNTMECDTSKFSRDDLAVKMSEDAEHEFAHLCMMLKVTMMDAKECDFNYDKMQDIIVEYSGNEFFLKRLRKLVSYYITRNWL